MIIKSINKHDFVQAFNQIRPDNFTFEGLYALYDHLQILSEDMGEYIELDVIALCCEYSQYESAYEAMEAFQPDDMPVCDIEGLDLIELQENLENQSLEWLSDRTTTISFKGGVIIQNF